MATLLELERRGFLARFDPQLGSRELENRQIYLSKAAQVWLEKKLPVLEAKWKSDQSPSVQVASLLADFCAGEKIAVRRQFHILNPRHHSVWELKTADVRLFGWFCFKDIFILVSCEEASTLKSVKVGQPDLYQRNVEHVRNYRGNLQLDEPKTIEGVDPNGVVSNCN